MMDPHRARLLHVRPGDLCVCILHVFKDICLQICPAWSCVCHESGSQLVWQFPRLPMKVVEEEEDQIVMMGCHLKGALSQSCWRHYGCEHDCSSGIWNRKWCETDELFALSVLFVFQSKNEAFAWALIGVSVTLLKHGLIRASILTSSYAGVCAVLTLTHHLLVQRTTDTPVLLRAESHGTTTHCYNWMLGMTPVAGDRLGLKLQRWIRVLTYV